MGLPQAVTPRPPSQPLPAIFIICVVCVFARACVQGVTEVATAPNCRCRPAQKHRSWVTLEKVHGEIVEYEVWCSAIEFIQF